MALDPDLLARILILSPAQRAELAHRLLLSLEPSTPDPDADELWAAEIERRAAAIDRGETQLTDWRQSIARVRNSLKPGPDQRP